MQPDAKDLVLKDEDYGMKLVRHNNPYNPGEKRLEQAINNVFTNGQIPASCSPDRVRSLRLSKRGPVLTCADVDRCATARSFEPTTGPATTSRGPAGVGPLSRARSRQREVST